MASFFGEVIHPSSRAFWTDEDEDDLRDSQDVELKFDWSEAEPPIFEKFIIVESEMVNAFVSSCLLKDVEIICTIKYSGKICAKIYSSNDVHICIIETKLDLADTGLITEAIAPLLSKSRSIFAVTSQHISNFKSEKVHSKSFIKALYSSEARDKIASSKIGVLSQPNIVTGVCAGGLSYAEIFDLHCIMYILFTDTFILDSVNALPLTELFSQLLEKPLKPQFKSLNLNAHNKGDLYM